MKKYGIILVVCFVLFCLCSCLSMDDISNANRNEYSSYAYSSKYTNAELTKEDELIILVDSSSYPFARSLEMELERQFEEQAIPIRITSDFIQMDMQDMMTEEALKESFMQLFIDDENQIIRYIGFIIPTSSNAYVYGGGFKDINITACFFDLLSDFSLVARIDVDIQGEENNFENFNSSMETVVMLAASEIVDEYVKFLTPVK